MISGGFAGGGESSSARKAHLRSIRSGELMEMQAVSKLPRLDTAITFSDSDLEGCQHPHDDPLVIRVVVANKTIHRVLIDNGSLIDIIFASAFDKMGIGREKLEPVNTHLRGFSEEKVLPLGLIQLELTLGDPPCQATTTVRFLIIDAPSAYNVLLGRPSLNAIKAIPSAYHMVIKFPTTNGVGMVRGDQHVAKECYLASMKHVLHKTETSRRLMKWAIELSEFDIRYKPKTAIKMQILAGFVMEFTSAELAEATQATFNLPIWRLSVGGAANAQGSGVDLILTSLEGIDIEYALRFGF